MVFKLDEFYENYNPELNKVLLKGLDSEDNPEDMTAFGGCMYETYGDEYDYVRNVSRKRVWTILDGDDGDMIISSGLWLVNRIGYIVTEEEYKDDFETYLVD